jgi:hypothetical protein
LSSSFGLPSSLEFSLPLNFSSLQIKFFNMQLSFTSSILLGLSLLPPAYSWGGLGHETIAYIATNFGN